MRWNIKTDPVNGDVRTIRRFAFKPIAIEQKKVWLEFYTVCQVFNTYRRGDFWVSQWVDSWKAVGT